MRTARANRKVCDKIDRGRLSVAGVCDPGQKEPPVRVAELARVQLPGSSCLNSGEFSYREAGSRRKADGGGKPRRSPRHSEGSTMPTTPTDIPAPPPPANGDLRSEEHTSELQSPMYPGC